MKEQINRFARGVFEYEPPMADITESSIYAVVDKNREYRGSLHISEPAGRILKGFVYVNNDKIRLDCDTFSGSQCVITYTVNSRGALNGDIIEGAFSIVCNGGEYQVPFSLRVEAGSHDTSTGEVRNLFNFANLAQTNIEEAITLFEADDFEDVYIGGDLVLRNLYEGLAKGTDPRNNIEEFLIAIHKKSRVNLRISENSCKYSNITENIRSAVVLERDTWGYSNVLVSTDSSFIVLERTAIESDSFTGGKYEFSYVIDRSKLHSGRNFGRIIFESVGQRLEYRVTAMADGAIDHTDRQTLSKLTCDITSLYIKFRTHEITINEWCRETDIVLGAVSNIEEGINSLFFKLVKAQLLIVENNNEEAKAIIEEVKDDISKETPSDYPMYCYYLYINSLYARDRMYSRKAAAAIKECYEEYPDWRILWVLLFMDEELESNPSLKLLRIKEQFNKGCASPSMYIEACNILNDNPALLRVMNLFETNVLIFGARHGILERNVAVKAAELVMSMRFGTDRYIRLMQCLYDSDPEEEILEGLCKILIRNNCTGTQYLEVYDRAIRAQLKITRLFEYYMMSRSFDDMSPLPKMVLMYFGYNNSLDYTHKAYLYSNIIYNKADNPQAYKSYLPQMETYVKEQMLQGHINGHIALLYRNLMSLDMINEENAGSVSEMYFTYKLTCNNKNFHKVIIRHKESSSEKEYPIVNGTAYVRMYTEDAAVFFVSDSGNRYSSSVQYDMVRLADNEGVMKKCLEADPSLVHLKLFYSEKNIKYQKKTLESVAGLIELMNHGEISRYYKQKLTSVILDYYYDSYDIADYDSFISNVRIDELDEKDIAKIIEIEIIQGHYKEAYELIGTHSYMQIIPKRLMKMCSRLIISGEYKDLPLMTGMCSYVFFKDMYDEMILQYLADYYNGTTKTMTAIWQKAVSFDIDTYDLEERIIAQSMFSHLTQSTIVDIFESYFSKGPKDRIIEAYLAYNSYLFFVKEQPVSEELFSITESSMENEKELPAVCCMALVKYYSGLDSLSQFQKELALRIIPQLVRKEYIFPFFSSFKEVIELPADIVDKTMVEYRGDPDHRVIIHYVFDNGEHRKSYISEDMKNIYEGVFVKAFVLFYGESVQYYITEEGKDTQITTDNVRITNHHISPGRSEGRYEAVNDILASREAHDAQTFQKLIHTYAVNEYLTDKLFGPIEDEQ